MRIHTTACRSASRTGDRREVTEAAGLLPGFDSADQHRPLAVGTETERDQLGLACAAGEQHRVLEGEGRGGLPLAKRLERFAQALATLDARKPRGRFLAVRAGSASSAREKLRKSAASPRRFFVSKKSWKELGAGPRVVSTGVQH